MDAPPLSSTDLKKLLQIENGHTERKVDGKITNTLKQIETNMQNVSI